MLVNNAGILPDRGVSFNEMPLDMFDNVLKTNLYGPFLMCQAFLPLMQENNYGRIVNVSSQLGQLQNMGSGMPAYRISKTALNALTKVVAAEVVDYDIIVSAVSPGWVQTDMGGAHAQRTVSEGADTIVWAALLPAGVQSGNFLFDRSVIEW